MNIKCEIIFDLESGDYDVRFHNLSAPGEPMDYMKMRPVVARILRDFDDRNMDESKREDASGRPSAPRRTSRR